MSSPFTVLQSTHWGGRSRKYDKALIGVGQVGNMHMYLPEKHPTHLTHNNDSGFKTADCEQCFKLILPILGYSLNINPRMLVDIKNAIVWTMAQIISLHIYKTVTLKRVNHPSYMHAFVISIISLYLAITQDSVKLILLQCDHFIM